MHKYVMKLLYYSSKQKIAIVDSQIRIGSFQLKIIFVFLLGIFLDDCEKDGTACTNGACLDSLCHCNDGYGGCNCQVPGEFFCHIFLSFRNIYFCFCHFSLLFVVPYVIRIPRTFHFELIKNIYCY